LDYPITQEQEIMRATVREFARSEVEPLAAKLDWEANLPEQLIPKLRDLGLFSISVPSEFGGAGADFLTLMMACEEISAVSGSLGAQVSLHNAVVCEAISSSKNSDLKTELLGKISAGYFGAFSTDPHSTITASISGSEVVLNGSSEYVMGATNAEVFLVLARLGEVEEEKKKLPVLIAFSRDRTKGDEGFAMGEAKRMLGLRASGTASISFRNKRLPITSLLFEPGRDSEAIVNSIILQRSRLAVGFQALGIGRAALESEVAYSNQRIQFKTKIGRFYAVQDFIATDEVSIETARHFSYRAAADVRSSSGVELERNSCIAKIASSNAAVQAARHSIRVHGGYGFIRDYPVERYLRDARATQIYLESNETLKAKLAQSLLESTTGAS
jgi:alkylation response protein AidB-like acyl-CoA dehydrogenase